MAPLQCSRRKITSNAPRTEPEALPKAGGNHRRFVKDRAACEREEMIRTRLVHLYGGEPVTQQETTYQYLGKGRKLVEGLEKVTGRAQYTGDLSLAGMLHIRPVLSPYAHARIV